MCLQEALLQLEIPQLIVEVEDALFGLGERERVGVVCLEHVRVAVCMSILDICVRHVYVRGGRHLDGK